MNIKSKEFVDRSNIKGMKRCPHCNSTNIYRRSRVIRFIKERRKENKNFIEERIKHYRCNKCKYEFDSPKIEYIE